MTQRRLGLVLGGGGGRGAAHVGVLRALEEAGIEVQALAGISAGAVIGAAYAHSGLGDELLATVERAAELRLLYRDRLRLRPANPLGRTLSERFRGVRLEALRLPLAVCAADVRTHEHVVFRSGPLLPALQASIAVPFLARPVPVAGRYLADVGHSRGGALAAIRAMNVDVVVEVLLYRSDSMNAPARLRAAAAPVNAALRRGSPGGAPRTRELISFVLAMALDGRSRAPASNVLITPRTPLTPLLVPGGARRAVQAGYDAAAAAIPRIRRLLDGAACA